MQQPAGDRCFCARASGVVVTGKQLSGMSTMVVIPPAAAARVAVVKPSHWVRPGWFTWTGVSIKQGHHDRIRNVSPLARIVGLVRWQQIHDHTALDDHRSGRDPTRGDNPGAE